MQLTGRCHGEVDQYKLLRSPVSEHTTAHQVRLKPQPADPKHLIRYILASVTESTQEEKEKPYWNHPETAWLSQTRDEIHRISRYHGQGVSSGSPSLRAACTLTQQRAMSKTSS